MDSRSSLFSVAAMVAIVAAVSTSAARQPAPAPQPAPAAAQSDTADGRNFTIGAQLIAESCVGEQQAGIPTCRNNPVAVRIFIATVPDARDPLTDWMYDEQVEAIRRAFEKSGYLFDRHWDPRAEDSVIVAGVKPAERRVAANRMVPGVLLLRSRSTPGDRALVYLVPETPTTGTAERAFRNALEERRRLIANDTAAGLRVVGDTLRVIGPTFSGSSASLAALLRGRAPIVRASTCDSVAPWAIVATGTATSLQNRAALADVATFYSTVHDDDTVLDEAARVLRSLDIPPHRVAILRETSTAYGLDASGTAPDAKDAQQAEDAKQSDADSLRARWMVVPFPLNIASVRNEYARNPDPATSASPSLLPARRTRVALESQLRTSTTIAPVSRLTAHGQERVIDEIVNMLRRERVLAVGIVATDIRDKLFLASLLRRRLRDVLLFTTEANNLLLRDERGTAMRGMLVLGTYPLHVENQRWLREISGDTEGGGERLAFAAEAQIGVYNATLLHFGTLDEDGLSYRTVVDTAMAWPPVWLSVIGTTGFAPLRTTVIPEPAYVHRLAQPTVPDPATPADPEEQTHARNGGQSHTLNLLNVTSWLAALLFGMLAYVYYADPAAQAATGGRAGVRVPGLRGSGRRMWQNTGGALVNSLTVFGTSVKSARAQATPLARMRSRVIDRELELPLLELDIHTWGVARLLLFASIFAPSLVLAARAEALRWDALGAAALTILLAGAAASVGLVRMLRCHADHADALLEARAYHSERFVRQLLVTGGFAYGLFTIMFLHALTTVGTQCEGLRCRAEFEHFFHRVMALDSGVSPLVPIALAMSVLFCWTGWHLGRTRALRDQTTFEASLRTTRADVHDQDERTTPGTVAHLAVALRQARWSLFSLAPRLSYGALSVLLMVIGVWLVWQFDRSLENLVLPPLWQDFSAFDWLFRASVVAVFGSIMWGIVRMHQNWNALRSVFERMAETPLLKAMASVRDELAGVGVPSLFLSVAQDAGFYNAERPFWNSRIEAVAARRWVALRDELAALPAEQRPLDPAECERIAAAAPDWGRIECAEREGFIGELTHALDTYWHGGAKTSAEARAWLEQAAQFVAVQAAAYCEWGQQILRRLALFLLLALLLTTLMLGSYPFQPQHLFKVLLVGLVALTVATLFLVTIEMNRDEVLSALTNSAAGRVEWNTRFVLNMVVFGAIPILTLLSSELPLLRTVLIGWIQPFVQSAANF